MPKQKDQSETIEELDELYEKLRFSEPEILGHLTDENTADSTKFKLHLVFALINLMYSGPWAPNCYEDELLTSAFRILHQKLHEMAKVHEFKL